MKLMQLTLLLSVANSSFEGNVTFTHSANYQLTIWPIDNLAEGFRRFILPFDKFTQTLTPRF